MGHTPGPWYVSGLPKDHHEEAINANGPICVACLPRRGEAGRRGEVDANARLIAAAPDLLAICQEIADDPRCDLVTSERRIRLYAAIRKALGA